MSNTTRTLSVIDAARRFADVVNRAFYRHETTVLLKNGVPVAFVAPMAPTGKRWGSAIEIPPAAVSRSLTDSTRYPTPTEPPSNEPIPRAGNSRCSRRS